MGGKEFKMEEWNLNGDSSKETLPKILKEVASYSIPNKNGREYGKKLIKTASGLQVERREYIFCTSGNGR